MTKVVFHNRRILAKQLALPEDAITMIEATSAAASACAASSTQRTF
jgi:hypothetical protein